MPTFQNNTDSAIKVTDISGKAYMLPPTASFVTHSYNVDSALTKISDEPMWNRIAKRTTATAGETISVSPSSEWLLIEKISDSISVYIQSTDNTPPEYANRTSDDGIIQIPIKGRCDQIVITGTGTCDVVEYNKDM